jgi:predicted transcriptional regulator
MDRPADATGRSGIDSPGQASRANLVPTFFSEEDTPLEDPTFTERELDIMSVLWRQGSGSVAEVRKALGESVTYTTVLKMLQILEEKGAVRHESEGRAYRYFPLVESQAAGGTALSRILEKIFGGSAELLLAQLVSDRDLTSEELGRMRRILEGLEEDPS